MQNVPDLSKLAGGNLPPEANVPGGVPILGQQQVPVLPGLPVNGKLITMKELREYTDEQFRELFLAVSVNLLGAVYSPLPDGMGADDVERMVAEEEAITDEAAEEEAAGEVDPEA